jgi:hypothetical protein
MTDKTVNRQVDDHDRKLRLYILLEDDNRLSEDVLAIIPDLPVVSDGWASITQD